MYFLCRPFDPGPVNMYGDFTPWRQRRTCKYYYAGNFKLRTCVVYIYILYAIYILIVVIVIYIYICWAQVRTVLIWNFPRNNICKCAVAVSLRLTQWIIFFTMSSIQIDWLKAIMLLIMLLSKILFQNKNFFTTTVTWLKISFMITVFRIPVKPLLPGNEMTWEWNDQKVKWQGLNGQGVKWTGSEMARE